MTTEQPIASRVAHSPHLRLMAVTNDRVAAYQRRGSNSYSGWLASIRSGITPSGELQALAAAGPFLDLGRPRLHGASLRAAAIRALNADVRHAAEQHSTVGSALNRLASHGSHDSIEEQVAALPLMPVDAAALVLEGLISRCSKAGVAVNFFDLADTLIFWGSGATHKSSSRRNKIVLDFHLGSTTNHSQR